jgi:hypothetical protein
MLEAKFGKNFKIEGGKTIAYDASGNQIFSKIKPGEPAEFDEAMQALFDSHPMKDSLYKASGSSGSGSQQNNGNGNPADKFANLKPTDRITAAREAGMKT